MQPTKSSIHIIMLKNDPAEGMIQAENDIINSKDRKKILESLTEIHQKIANKIKTDFPQIDTLDILAFGIVVNITDANLVSQVAKKLDLHVIPNFELELIM